MAIANEAIGPVVPTNQGPAVEENAAPSFKDRLGEIANHLSGFSKNMLENTNFSRTGRSDERLKDAEPDTNMDVLSIFTDKIQNYTWNYKPDNKLGLDPTETHIGPMAQDLLKVPGLESTVVQDESGYLAVDAAQLSLANTGLLSDIAKRLQVLEEIVYMFVEQMQSSQQDGGIQGV